MRSFSYASHQCGRNSPTLNGCIYRWCTQRASSMCMSPRARWKMVHCSYLYMLSVSVMQADETCTSFSNYTAWKWQLEKKNHDLVPELTAYTQMRSFSCASHQCGRNSPTPNWCKYTVTGGSQYCGHLRPVPKGSVRWCAQRASSMCMSPRARWKMMHCSYLYMFSVTVMQAGETCTSFSNYTAWKWQPENMAKDFVSS